MKTICLFSLAFGLFIFGFSARMHAAPEDEAYFKQFLYSKINQSNDPDFPEFFYTYLGSSMNLDYRISPTSKTSFWMNLALVEDYSFQMHYREQEIDTGSNSFKPGPCRIVTGTWAVPDKELVLSSGGKIIAVGNRDTNGLQYFVKFKFVSAIASPHLADLEDSFVQGFSNVPREKWLCF